MKIILFLKTLLLFLILSACKEDDVNNAPTITGFSPVRGVPGTAVVINGHRLAGGDVSVSFNGTSAVVTAESATSVTALVPSGTTSGPIAVTVGTHTLVTSTDFEVLIPVADDPGFLFGADLSYVNQILDHGGEYREGGVVKDPYEIFAGRGTDLVRLRLWHNPVWTKEVYNPEGSQLYNDLLDVERSITRARQEGMKVMLDIHYSDVWADPGNQEVPAAWLDIKELSVLRDSVYAYTRKTLEYLNERGLMPDFVQIGNEINCGMLYEYEGNPVPGFPAGNSCNGQWSNLAAILNSGIKAVRDVSSVSTVKSKIILHIADPGHVTSWLNNIAGGGVVTDFDIIGVSYYPIWHTGTAVDVLSDRIAGFKSTFKKDVMIVEVAYPWSRLGNDNYNNIFGAQAAVPGYAFSPEGQLAMMKTITQEIVDGGGIGVVYWEPAWISSSIRDLWNTGSSWENCTFFDFEGNTLPVMDYMTHDYDR